MNLEITQIAAVRKHAMTFAASLRKAGHDVESLEMHTLDWQALNQIEKDARHAARALADKIGDKTDDNRAAEIEGAFDGLTAIAAEAADEKDLRTAKGDRSPRNGVDKSKRPTFEPRSVSAVDGGDDFEPEAEWALAPQQRMRAYAQARSNDAYEGLSAGRLLRAMVTGATTDAERRALAEGSDSAGGYTVPKTLSAQLIDNLRAASVCVRAGAQTVPLDSNKHSIAKVVADAVPAWRAENAALNESAPTFGQILFEPKSLAVLVKVSRELLDDSLNVGTALPAVLTATLAQELDRVALIGSGTAPEPRGITSTTGIGTTAHNAALASYGPLLAARTGLLTANVGEPTAVIMHPRDEGTLSGLVDTTGQPLSLPPRIAGLQMLTSTQIPTDGGAGDNESKIIVGDFRKLLIGMRQEIRIEILKERYADNHQVAFVAHIRADIAVQHAAAFHVITGVQG